VAPFAIGGTVAGEGFEQIAPVGSTLPLTFEGALASFACRRGTPLMSKIDLLQGTLDMLILRVLARGEMHGWGIVDRLSQLSKNTLKLGEGSVYPSLYRMEAKGWIKAEWAASDNNRKAKYYSLTKAGRKQLEAEQQNWDQLSAIIAEVMQKA
jgi:PadR family transcriptional regulator, regulatory protein PadR